MKRPRLQSLVAVAALTILAASGSASAAILSYGCQGQLGDQRVLFNRDGLYLVDAKAFPVNRKKFGADTVSDAIESIKQGKGGYTQFESNGNGDLDETPMEFSRTDGQKTEKAVFTYVSAKRLSHRHRMICGRDEDTDLYRSVYRYERDGGPAREINMQCFFYQLSTRGGRKGCD